METCSNCGTEITGKYCHNCGQEKVSKRLGTGYLFSQAVHGIFHWESSILYTFKELLIRPGTVVQNYIKGKRKPYVKPIAYFIFIQALYVLTVIWMSAGEPEKNFSAFNILSFGSSAAEENRQIHNIVASTVKYYIFVIPLIFAFFLKVFTKKQNDLNYAESMVFTFYVFGSMLVFQVFTLLLTLISDWLWNAGFLFVYIYLAYSVIQFSGYGAGKGILKSIMIIVCGLVTFQLLMAMFQFTYFSFFFH
ncbi:MAG: DUF3667 domain-containing protein [Ignavibacteria bacterium]|nr:DUF3667 domain-containing protein [Ignavibacteria bacterium]